MSFSLVASASLHFLKFRQFHYMSAFGLLRTSRESLCLQYSGDLLEWADEVIRDAVNILRANSGLVKGDTPNGRAVSLINREEVPEAL